MRLIENHHIESWAGSRAAEGDLPRLIKDLIFAVIEPTKLRMPSGDAVWLPGYDGYVVNEQENRFVPVGRSAWELGTTRDSKEKAKDDYKKRSNDKDDASDDEKAANARSRKSASFVFVTPYLWKDKEKWVAAHKRENKWQDVVVIDGEDLKNWLESAPSMSLRFAAELGLVPEAGLQTPDQAWEDWRHRTRKPMSEELVVAGRIAQEKDLFGRLLTTPSTFTVRALSPQEAWGFTLATLRRIEPPQDRENLYARSIVADNEEVATRLRNCKNLIVILKQARGHVSGALSSRGSHVVVPEGNDARSIGDFIELTRPSHRDFAQALVQMGFSEDEAERATRACGLSVTVFQRQQAHANYDRPGWANVSSTSPLLAALLAGRWSNLNELDRTVIARLAGTNQYEDVENTLRDLLCVDEPPLQNVGEIWTLTAPADAFELMARRLTPDHLNLFEAAFRDVFGRLDPRVEIDPDQWFFHDNKDERTHSKWLRAGMAETLLLIAQRGSAARLQCNGTPPVYAAQVVRGLPGLNDDWRLLASIRDEFGRLMEAAPDPLFDSLEHLLGAKPDDVRRLFAEGSSALGGGAMHTGILRGLEAMAWSPEHLPRIALVLAKLAALDPGGRIINRPINSLKEIFNWWNPGTIATTQQRLASIDLILFRLPNIGWALISAMLPASGQSYSRSTQRPRWLDFGDFPQESRTQRGQMLYLSAVADRAIDHVAQDPQRWEAVLRSLKGMSDSQQERVVSLLSSLSVEDLEPKLKSALWDVLREFVARNRAYEEAHWAVSEDLLSRLEPIVLRLAPNDPVEEARWLFDEWLPLRSGEHDYDELKLKIQEARKAAVANILESKGNEGLVQLASTCKYPGFAADAAVPQLLDVNSVLKLIDLSIDIGECGVNFAGQVSGPAMERFGGEWRDLVLKEARTGRWSPATAGALVAWWPDERTTWEDVTALGQDIAAEYWKRKQLRLIRGSADDQAYQIDRLIEAGRASEAFDRIVLHSATAPAPKLLQLFDATFKQAAQADTPEKVKRLGLDSHNVREFLSKLRSRSDISREEIARREYCALPILGYELESYLTLYEFMVSDAKFFVDILCDAFLPANRDKSQDAQSTPEATSSAHVAVKLLRGMHKIPGQGDDGQLDEAILLDWIENVRELSEEQDRAVIATLKIGEILAHSGDDPEDGAWPHKVIRNVIERYNSQYINRGLMIERFNMRGVHSRNPYEGGDQERALAATYRGWASVCRARWPVVARVLKIIANNWEEKARREDLRAEQDKLG